MKITATLKNKSVKMTKKVRKLAEQRAVMEVDMFSDLEEEDVPELSDDELAKLIEFVNGGEETFEEWIECLLEELKNG